MQLPAKHLFILPGNPPARYFYELWAAEICAGSPGSVIEIARYPFGETTRDSPKYFRALVRKLTEEFLLFQARCHGSASIVGHSLGGYLGLKILEAVSEQVESCYLLHPFLRQPSWRGRAVLRLAHALCHVPHFDRWLLRVRPLVALVLPEAVHLTAEEIHVFTQLAYHEHRSIAQDHSEKALSEDLRSKVCVYSTPNDMWCPPATVASLGRGVHHVVGAASHNFIVHRAERDLLQRFLANGT